MKKHCGYKIVGAIVIGTAFVFLYIFAFQSLWNWIVPEVFNGPTLKYIHAFGILLLAKMLFGGFHHRKSGRWEGWKNKKKQFWKQQFREKWQHMSDDEKAALKNKFKSKFGRCWGEDISNKAPLVLLALCLI